MGQVDTCLSYPLRSISSNSLVMLEYTAKSMEELDLGATRLSIVLWDTNQILNRLVLHNMYVVTDNARIRKTIDVHKAIHDHRHTTLFLSPYSLFLNPIATIKYIFIVVLLFVLAL